MKEALHTVMTDLLYNSNLVNFTVRLPEFYVFKGYETLAGAMGTQYEFGHGKCNVSATTVAHPGMYIVIIIIILSIVTV